jgi:AcrR family transcriptional regulator
MPAEERLSPRKSPRQQRSRQTVDAILEAATRIFGERGYAGGTTNHIAEQAGVSVGSLYEYFPNKDAILVALAERRLDGMIARVQRHLEAVADDESDPDTLLRGFVTGLLEAHEREPHLDRVVFSEAPHPAELHGCVLRMEESLAHSLQRLLSRCRGVSVQDDDTAAHLIVQTGEALTHRFVHQGIHDLERDAFLDEVVLLLVGYVTGSRSAVRS